MWALIILQLYYNTFVIKATSFLLSLQKWTSMTVQESICSFFEVTSQGAYSEIIRSPLDSTQFTLRRINKYCKFVPPLTAKLNDYMQNLLARGCVLLINH